MEKIVLLGYMGSGKSVIGKLLSRKVNLDLLDLDQVIEKRAGMSVNKIFQEKGEIYFRKLESTIFKELMWSEAKFILSVGGGTPCYSNNYELLQQQNVFSVYLKASVEELYNRLTLDKENRPIIASKEADELKEFIAKHLFDRGYYYNQAKHKILVDGKSCDKIVAEIVMILA